MNKMIKDNIKNDNTFDQNFLRLMISIIRKQFSLYLQ